MTTQSPNTKNASSPAPAPAPSRFSRGLLAAAIGALGIGAIGAGVALAQDAPILRHAAGDGPRAEMRHARFGEERGRMAQFMEWRLERTLEEVDASPEQVERIKAIADEARGEIAPLMRGFRDTREDLAEILGAETIDRAAAETLRAERLAAMDAASARGLQALLDAAEVLEPEQRAELVEEMGERRRGWGRW
ncbi:MAG: Spy/CpxP family protein refolding chaperone [Salinarimonas sp.]